MFVTVFKPTLFILPWEQLSCDGKVRLKDEMWFVVGIEFHQPLCFGANLFYQALHRQFTRNVDVDGMAGKAAIVFEFDLNGRETHGDGF